jgi:short-subunit dehydrogenase
MGEANRNQTVLITGASTGIGYELTKLFAKDNYNLVLVSRNKERLDVIAEELYKAYGLKIKVIAKDLSIPNTPKEIFDEVMNSNIHIDVLVNNAGAGSTGLFHEINHERDLEIIQLNITSLTSLTKLFAKEMAKVGEGKILNVASTGSYQPGPYIAVYYATKAYVLSFSQAIRNELRDFGIAVTTVCPGATRTEFSKRAGKSDLKNSMDAKIVARVAYLGMNKNSAVVIPGFANKFAVFFSKLLPGNISASIVKKIQSSLVIK